MKIIPKFPDIVQHSFPEVFILPWTNLKSMGALLRKTDNIAFNIFFSISLFYFFIHFNLLMPGGNKKVAQYVCKYVV